MAATHVAGSRAASDFPLFTGRGGGNVKCAYGIYEIAAALDAASTIEICHLPKGAIVLGGYLFSDDIDTGTEALELDVGTKTKGTDHGDASEDDDAFHDSGVVSGAAVTDHVPATGQVLHHFNKFGSGPKTLTVDTTVYINVTAAADAGGTGTVGAIVNYLMP